MIRPLSEKPFPSITKWIDNLNNNTKPFLDNYKYENNKYIEPDLAFLSGNCKVLIFGFNSNDLKIHYSWKSGTILTIEYDNSLVERGDNALEDENEWGKDLESIPWEVFDGKNYLSERFIIIRHILIRDIESSGDCNERSEKKLVHFIGGDLDAYEQKFLTLFNGFKNYNIINLVRDDIKNLKKDHCCGEILQFTCCGHLIPKTYIQISRNTNLDQNLSLDSLKESEIRVLNNGLVFSNTCIANNANPLFSNFFIFAEEFLYRGAGYFIGTLGTIPPEQALKFANNFYKELSSYGEIPPAFIGAKHYMKKENIRTHILYFFYTNSEISQSIMKALNKKNDHLKIKIEINAESFIKYQLTIGSDYIDIDDMQPLTKNWAVYIADLYEKINKLNPGKNRVEETNKNLERIGHSLYDDLFSIKLKEIFESRINGKVKTILLLVDERASQLPWELIIPPFRDSSERYQHLCEGYRMGRWLIGSKVTNPMDFRISPMALISHNPGSLNGIAEEAEGIKNFKDLKAKEIIPKHANLELLFSDRSMNGCCSLHLSGNNKINKKKSLNTGVNSYYESSFELQDKNFDLGDFMFPDNILFGEARPFVFLNFCESNLNRQTISEHQGWASIFLKKIGSPCLVATMWKAKDKSAALFSPALYEALLEGETIGKAMQIARKKIKNLNDPTWLCYVLYGDPRTKLAKT